MRLVTSNLKRTVDIGGSDIWYSIYSTVEKRLGFFKRKIPLAIEFLKSGKCDSENALESARQFNLLRDELAKYAPNKAVYTMDDMTKAAPWEDDLSPVVTSCANLYTTADGKDLLFEIVSILTYAYYLKVSVSAER